MNEPQTPAEEHDESAQPKQREDGKRVYLCDRCGFQMIEKNCKVVCPNCGSRYDCSDLNIYFD